MSIQKRLILWPSNSHFHEKRCQKGMRKNCFIFRKLSWELLYSVKSSSSALDAQLEEDIPQATLTKFITLKVTGSSDKYISSLVQNSDDAYRYFDLFPLYISERVSEMDYSKIGTGLVTAWNSVLKKTVAQSADILRQEEVITASGWVWSVFHYSPKVWK